MSALVGLLAAAHGRPRGSDVNDLTALSLVIRVDKAGEMMRDYHTVGGGYPKGARIKVASGGERSEAQAALVSERYYLADAAFTVALSGDPHTVASSGAALEHPRWAPALGRRSCPPAEPFILGVVDDDPVIYLRDVLPVVRDVTKGRDRSVTFIVDDPEGQLLGVRDVPVRHWTSWNSYGERGSAAGQRNSKRPGVTDPLALVSEKVGV